MREMQDESSNPAIGARPISAMIGEYAAKFRSFGNPAERVRLPKTR
jgi:hypothetical protein